MATKESIEEAVKRWDTLKVLQNEYKEFTDFLIDVQLEVFGWTTSEMQLDIARFLQYGSKRSMVQAQRGQAKTTITICYAVWCLIQDPSYRIVVVSAGGTLAREIATGILKIFRSFTILECMLPDKAYGDRSSTESFDVHYTLKGDDKSPSVKCMGITADKAGSRADLLISDDVESDNNSQTETARLTLEQQTKEYTAICIEGKILYLGTPQTSDSIYNLLPSKGYEVRVWTGRYPTEKQEKEYSDTLAPYIVQRMKIDPTLRTGGGITGTQGKPTDSRLDEDTLQGKELDIGTPHFKLQYMLSTILSDQERYPLKLRNLIFMDLNKEEAPAEIKWLPKNDLIITPPSGSSFSEALYKPFSLSQELMPYTGKMMYVDVAGGGANGDATAYTITYFLNGYIFVMDWGSIKGGYEESAFRMLSEIATKWQVNNIVVEKNFGNGAFAAQWQGYLVQHLDKYIQRQIEDDWVSGQKELRIIDGLEPVMGRHHLIFNTHILEKDVRESIHNEGYALLNRKLYSGFFQMSKITRDKGSLIHDDLVDSLASAVRYWVKYMAIAANKMLTKEKVHNLMNWSPNGDHLHNNKPRHNLSGLNMMKRWMRSKRV